MASSHFGLSHTMRCLYAGQSVLRIRMNEELSAFTLSGRVVDVGGGRSPDYFSYLKKDANVRVEAVDGSLSSIDFETEPLPYEDASVDTALCCNVLEHLYNHQFLLGEIHRILRPGGELIGFVPFWVGYHPDPHDYFRYTAEALKRMLSDAGFSGIAVRPLRNGPVLANFNTIVLSLPRFARPLLYPFYAALDSLFLRVRPASAARNPLGFVFSGHV